MKRKNIIGLTGPTGAGKSLVASILASHGCEIVDCDKISREIYLPGSCVLADLAEAFGKDILTESNSLNRLRLAERAFSSPENVLKLNSITHPAILKISFDRAKNASSAGKAVVIDAAALFESAADKDCDFTVAVTAPEKIRLERILERDKIDKEAAVARMKAQQEELFYCERADYIIRNYPPYNIHKEAEAILERLGEEIDE